MSGDKKQPDPYKAERQEAAQQNGTLDAVMDMTKVINPWGPNRGFHFGKTSFEGYDLNEMIDIVESANPELVETAGTALVAARDAITKAAEELSVNVGDVDWEGEAHSAFFTWGTDLVSTANALANYADVVGTQVLAASSGLASVRKSMPPRDSRTDPKTVDDIPEAKRVDSNDEYTAAVKAESHRQEAINQMYRLASFYTVSGGMMQTAEEPVFPKMPDVGVPEPAPSFEPPEKVVTRQESLSTLSDSGTARRNSMDSGVERPRPDELLSPQEKVDESVGSPERHVGTEIDSVGTLPPQETMKPTTGTSTAGPNVNSVTPAPMAPVAVPPAVRGQAGRTSGFGGVPAAKAPTSARGRVGGMPGATQAGRTGTGPIGPMGRAAAPGQAGGRAVGPMGRGVVGGTPRATGPAANQTGGVPRGPVTGMGVTNPGRTGSARVGVGRAADGVVGGKPVTGAAPGDNGARVPRGTVIGAQGAPTPRSTGERPGQRGVIGAPAPTTGTGQTVRRPVGGSDGVVGTPKGRTSGAPNGGRTPGGTGVTRGPAGNQSAGETRPRRDERRDASVTD